MNLNFFAKLSLKFIPLMYGISLIFFKYKMMKVIMSDVFKIILKKQRLLLTYKINNLSNITTYIRALMKYCIFKKMFENFHLPTHARITQNI